MMRDITTAFTVASLLYGLSGCDVSDAPATGEQEIPAGKADYESGVDDLDDEPLYPEITRVSFESWPSLREPVEVYFPRDASKLPVAVLLQGANVDKAFYSRFATSVAEYGFMVIVPNASSLVPPGLFPRQSVITKTLEGVDAIEAGEAKGFEQLEGLADPQTAAVLGHSFGGAAGLNAIAGNCNPPFCLFGSSFDLPKSVRAGVFFGVNNVGPRDDGGPLPSIDAAVPVALVQGLDDTVGAPDKARRTFDAIIGSDAALVTLQGVNHYGITDVNNPEGADPDLAEDLLDQEVATDLVGDLTGNFLRAWVLHDELAFQTLERASELETIDEFLFVSAQ